MRDAGYRPGRIEAIGPAETMPASAVRVGARNDDGYDLAVIGSGPAAFAAAIRATNLGARVALIERGTVGGRA